MARKWKPTTEAAALAKWAEPKTKGKKRTSMWNVAEVTRQVDEMTKAHSWEGATGKHFVALYMTLHARVYGVEALELSPAKIKLAAASLAAKAMRELFDGSPDEMANFMRWVWQRQAVDEKKRKAGASISDFRVSWRYQFSKGLVTNYRRDVLARGGR